MPRACQLPRACQSFAPGRRVRTPPGRSSPHAICRAGRARLYGWDEAPAPPTLGLRSPRRASPQPAWPPCARSPRRSAPCDPAPPV